MEGISKACITLHNVLFVAVAVIARMHPALSVPHSKEALSLIYEGRKLCDLTKCFKYMINHSNSLYGEE